jgi:TRAP transporter 4TM/12TM fusion protein
MKYAYNLLAIFLSCFVLVAVNSTILSLNSCLALFALLGLVLVFLDRPMVKCCGDWMPLRILNWIMIAATVAVFGYVLVQSDDMFSKLWVEDALLGDRAGNEKTIDFVVAGIGLLLILDATRRVIGWTLPILCALFSLYAMFGQSMPDWCFPHAGNDWKQIVQKTYLQGGVFGIALSVMFRYVFLFVFFGAMLEQTGATGYVINFARRLFRGSTGGPAKIAVLSSGLMGSLSGSAVANTAATGTFTIPLMKSSGFDADTAGGVEAAASSGGALMPPIMGAGAYMMLEMVQPSVDYIDIIKAALIPAILYYLALLLTVHFHAKRIGAAAETPEQDSSQAGGVESKGTQSDSVVGNGDSNRSPFQALVFFGSFVVLIVALLSGLTPFRAVSISLIAILILSTFSKDTRLNGEKLLAAFVGAAKGGVALIVAASCVGIILGVIDLTPLSSALPMRIQSYAGDNAILALVMLMVSTIVLGMGLPSAVCYLLMASLVGSVLVTLDTPPLAAHLFIFYFGMMSMVTPPVALAAYAAAAISGGNVMRTALEAFRFALVGFALPFAFVLKPELLMLTPTNEPAGWWAIATTVICTTLATLGLAAAVAGYFAGRLNAVWRIVLLLLSVVVFFTRNTGAQWQVQLAATGVIVLALGWRGFARKPTDFSS